MDFLLESLTSRTAFYMFMVKALLVEALTSRRASSISISRALTLTLKFLSISKLLQFDRLLHIFFRVLFGVLIHISDVFQRSLPRAGVAYQVKANVPPTFTSLGTSGSLNDFGASTTPIVSATDASQLTSMPPANLVVGILWRSLVIINYLCLEPFVLMIFRRIWEVSCFLYDLGFSTDVKPKLFFVLSFKYITVHANRGTLFSFSSSPSL